MDEKLRVSPKKWNPDAKGVYRGYVRVSNLKYESVSIDSQAVVFIRANPGIDMSQEFLVLEISVHRTKIFAGQYGPPL